MSHYYVYRFKNSDTWNICDRQRPIQDHNKTLPADQIGATTDQRIATCYTAEDTALVVAALDAIE